MNVTLHTGEIVDSYSEEWRLECEARSVLAMPTIERRRAYLDGIRKFRGEDGHKYLADRVLAIWKTSKERK